ncbi:MAG: D-2-hydroxyacid dehydrogenase [Armatimonadaceae bacterium]
MKIVVLDSMPLDAEGDLNWLPLQELGELTRHPQTRPGEVAERIRDADAVFTNKVRLSADHFAEAPNLRLVSVLATGYDIVEVAAARQRGITVCNVPGYSTPSTAQTTIALLLELCHRTGDHAQGVRDGAWIKAGIWSWWQQTPVELDGKTLLIVGYGAVGKRVGQIAEALGMTVIAAQLPGRDSGSSEGRTVQRVPLEDALPLADVVSLHCPLTPETRELMNQERLARMKPGAFLLNTARGGLVADYAVRAALETGRLGGYGADVLGVEPPPSDHPLLSAPYPPNCLITAHFAWASFASRSRLLADSIQNLRSFLAGTPQNVVS